MAYNGYKGMLRDRMPKIIDISLKWCKAKERWIDHVYDNFIAIIPNNTERGKITRAILGIKKGKTKQFDFHRSIFWDQFDMTQQELEYWKYVEGWVNWFRTVYIYIEDMYVNSKNCGKYEKEKFKEELLNSNFLTGMSESTKNKIVPFLIKMLEQS